MLSLSMEQPEIPPAQELDELRRRLAQAEADKARAEAALRQSETRFNAFVDNSPCVAFLKDTENRLVSRDY
jgi:PAS domain-containing protein